MKHGVKNILPCLACQPFSSANLAVEHETKPDRTADIQEYSVPVQTAW